MLDLGKRAAERLIARVEGEATEPQVYRLEAALIRQEFCAPPHELGEVVG